jgi:hypothetical protein
MEQPGSEQSWTDILTNETFVHPLNDLVEPSDVIGGKIPIGAVPPLIHEAAHHSCLSSAVGLALAAADLQARRLAASGSKSDLERASTIVLTNRLVIELYRPLLEGLALFAEFDALPGSSRIISRPLLFTLRHTVPRDKADQWQRELFAILTAAWQTRGSVDRRRDVLGTSLMDRGGYLLGYLYVKTWSGWVSRRAPIFHDSDFAFFFLSEYFWNDFELAALLLDETGDEVAALRRVLDYCFERLYSVTSTEIAWDEQAAIFEQITLDNEIDDPLAEGFTLGPVPFPGEAAEAGREKLERLVASFPLEEGKILARRNMLHLFSLPVVTELVEAEGGDPRIVALFRGQPMMFAVPDPSYRGGGGNGTVDVFMETATAAQCIAITVDGELAHFTASGKHREFLSQWARQFQVARGSSGHEPAADLISELDGGELSRRGSRLVEASHEPMIGVYARLALAWIAPESRETLLRAPAGFRSLLGSELAESLAIVSAGANAQVYLEELKTVDKERDLSKAIAAIEERLGPLGVHPLRTWTEQDEGGNALTRIMSFA